MAQALSSVLKLTDLNDFITPSQACIKPPPENTSAHEKVSISLADCLACSGCVTSAETVLINQQSHEEFLNYLNSPLRRDMSVFASLSHQAIVSLAAKYNLSFQETAQKLSGLLKGVLGVDRVFDLTAARTLSIIESAREFIQVWKRDGKNWPILNSVCPGWVCYVEKTHGSLVQNLSQVKSPQQIMGSLLKKKLVPPADASNSKPVYHLSIMPCFDKKLEASREYFVDSETGEKDVDCVLTPIEIEQLLHLKDLEFTRLPSCHLDQVDCHDASEDIKSHSGSGSGGYAENVLKLVASELFHVSIDSLKYSVRRNKDFQELTLSCDGTTVPLTFAIVNGFRNIQTLVQMIKRNKCPYQYVEVMACPGGCLNGGAQVKPEASPERNFLDSVTSIYSSLEVSPLPPSLSDAALSGYYPKGEKYDRDSVLHTQFKQVPKTSNLLTLRW